MAAFEVSDQNAGVEQQLLFSNKSTGQSPLTHHWDFGDGHTATSINPYHVYAASGEYLVTLVVRNRLGEASHTMPVHVSIAPNIQMMREQNVYAGVPFVVQAFSDGSETSLVWSMGDGTEYTGFWINHTYDAPGEYLVTLNISNAYGNTIISEWVLVQDNTLRPADAAALVASPLAKLHLHPA
ncbi:MAG: PKD domain-containing protein [Chloroflexi bacterium]|nr:PKD domain-containing protein [Chloroflexota bacterium]